ncbi:MAG TPA: RNA polymerase sigma factor region1.1 domain-containing protein, partial [Burkholderiales bacterium]|nr:RNA polymerase sigma factor region1.1 domain-containing protein [Burkholderiales bacterium]
MAKDKRKTTTKQARKAKKKVKSVKKLKLKSSAKRRPAAKKKAKLVRAAARPARKRAKPVAAKKPAHAKRPAQAKKPAAPAKGKPLQKPAAAAAAAPEAKAGKKGKAKIQNTKQALELLEAKVNAGLKAAKEKKGRGGRKARREEWLAAAAELPKEDAEARRTRLKTLIKLGKDRGFLTYVEINDHLPDDLVDAEQIESIISTFADMGIQVYDQAPDQESLLITEAAPVASNDEDVEEQAEAALSTVDSEFGRTTDPVRMYMREMGSVELLTREGEIEIAKRIEEGLRHMVQAISACPTTIHEVLDLAERVEKEEMRIDEVVDGLVDPDAKDEFDPKRAESEQEEDETIEEEIEEEEDDDG